MKTEAQMENSENLELTMTDTSGDGTSYSAVQDSQADDGNEPNSKNLAGQAGRSSSASRRGTGPRTKAGKARSRGNATKHGIFSSAILLKDESKAEFDSILDGLRDDFQPEGAMEISLVETLAVDLWRARRLNLAETAEVRRAAEFTEWDEKQRQYEAATRIFDSDIRCNGGLIRKIGNPHALDRCLELLEELTTRIEQFGFELEGDRRILTKLYGEYRLEQWRESLFGSYLYWVAVGHCPDEKSHANKVNAVKCQQGFLKELDQEIARLKRHRTDRASIESKRAELEPLSRSIPDGPQLDRFLRYRSAIERSIESKLRQLERLQRMRLGQPVAPSIDVNVSSA